MFTNQMNLFTDNNDGHLNSLVAGSNPGLVKDKLDLLIPGW